MDACSIFAGEDISSEDENCCCGCCMVCEMVCEQLTVAASRRRLTGIAVSVVSVESASAVSALSALVNIFAICPSFDSILVCSIIADDAVIAVTGMGLSIELE